MVLQVIAPMLTLPEIKIVHLEPTDVCQAACPLCVREVDKTFDPRKKHHLTIPMIQKHLSNKTISSLDKILMCGNYGDPAAGKHTLDIYRWFRDLSPNITLGMNTNGALRDPQWWGELASMLNRKKDFVVFSIDGLSDTNHIYRKNVDWSTLMRNVKAYIDLGGNAHWDMLVYKHNEHQVEACEQLAKDLGFKWFRAKVSKRPLLGGLEYPVNWAVPAVGSTVISCQAIAEKSIYIDAQGKLSPCCWVGCQPPNVSRDIKKLQNSWKTPNPEPICAESCSVAVNKTNFTNQWRYEIEF